MEEEKKKVEQQEVDDEDKDLLDPDDFDDEDDEEGEEGGETDTSDEEDKKSSEKSEEEKLKEKNAKAAERRRHREQLSRERAEREAKIRAEATLQAKLGILKVNPYTEEPIEDEEDLKIYELQKELDDEGKDPINDLPKKIAENARKAAKEAKDRQEKEARDKEAISKKVNEEVEALRKKYPKANLAELARDDLYKECLSGRAGRWTQIEIYELYLQRKSEADKKAKEEAAEDAAEKAAKKLTNPPSATARGSSPQKKIEEMTPEEYEEYFRGKYGA